jgi:hypothetical protein
MMCTHVESQSHQEKKATRTTVVYTIAPMIKKNEFRSCLTVPYKTSHEFDQVQKVAIGCLIVSSIMPLDERPRSQPVPVMYFAVNPVRPDHSDPDTVLFALLCATRKSQRPLGARYVV